LQATGLSPEEIRRYGRHLIIPEIGLEGQKKLRAASVLVVGAGGLGSPAAMYLAAAGIGRIGLVDYDTVDVSNLQRQLLHSTSDVGRPKVASAVDRMRAVNTHVKTEAYETVLNSKNALEILSKYDVIIDGSDNFPTRYLVNDSCALLAKPMVYGSVFRFDGQVSVFFAERGPCYRCLHPEPPPPNLVPNCSEGGVLGVLPGIVGTVQAAETIKLLLGIGNPLIGRLLVVDALRMDFREFKLGKNSRCLVCGERPSLTELLDYEAFCRTVHERLDRVNEISVEELKEKLDRGETPLILDVREPVEHEIANIGGRLIPLNELPARLHELDTMHETVVYCHYGTRSARAVRLLIERGFATAKNLIGGIDAWSVRIDPDVSRY
jgi:adenylyltransferase/sulfurtransferase